MQLTTLSLVSPRHHSAVPAVLLLALLCTTPVFAGGDRVAELERRVAELESALRRLLTERETSHSTDDAGMEHAMADAAQARIEAERTREELAEFGRRIEPVIAAAEERADEPEFFYGGYIKADFIASSYEDGDLPGDSIGRDFFVASTIPIGGEDESFDLDAHARQTRFHFGTRHTIGEDHALGSYIELDFLATAGGNERVSNSFSPRLRHAYVTWNNWLVGQTWQTFMDVATLPESVDFIGPAGSTSFGRQPQIRYRRGGFAIALENPETTVTPNDGGQRIETDDNFTPDLATRYTWSGDWGHVQLGAIARQLELEDDALGVDDSEIGWGLSLSGKAMLGRDDIRWMVHHGDGLGRYVGLNFANGAAITDNGNLDAIGTTGAFVAYRHWWNGRWRSSAVLSWLTADNPARFTGENANETNFSGQINLFYSPVPPLSFGIEYLAAERELENGADGRMNRFQFTTRYVF